MKVNKYYSLYVDEDARSADINIYGDITSWPWLESDVSAFLLSKQITGLDVDTINVYINSYGGEVAEGLAIYNTLKRHKAKVKTVCDGFACSIASVIFMAGDERVMNNASLLMIHNAWTYASGNAKELRKQAEDLDKISEASIKAYLEHIDITEDELKELLDDETWLSSSDALELGFASSVIAEKKSDKATQSVKKSLMKLILESQEDEDEDENTDPETDDDTEDLDPDETENEDPDDEDEDLEEKGDEDEDPEESDDDDDDNAMESFFKAFL